MTRRLFARLVRRLLRRRRVSVYTPLQQRLLAIAITRTTKGCRHV